MNKKKVWIIIGVVLFIAGIIGANVWRTLASKNIEVEVTKLKEEVISETIMIPGQLKLANQQTIYYAPEKGDIDEILVKEGDKVEKGTPLVRYVNNQLRLELEQNDLQQQSTRLQIEHVNKQRKELDKQRKEHGENDQLDAEIEQLKLQAQQANLDLEQLQLQKQSIEEQINQLTVKSEISGKVIDIDEEAAAGAAEMNPKPLMRLGTMEQFIVEGVISEYDTLKIKEGQTVKLTSDAIPGETWKGNVSFISDLPKETETLGAEGGTGGVQYPIEITVEAEEINLKPGFQMVVEITTDEHKAQTLPITAVKQDGDKNYVYVVTKENIIEYREVTVGTATNDRIEITDGVSANDRVVVNPGDKVKDGAEVSIK